MTAQRPSRRSLGAIVYFGIAAVACAKDPPKLQRPAVSVSVTAARRADVPYTIDANGLVTPLQTAAVAAQVDGLIKRVTFREGDEVRKGQVLFEIDSRPYRNTFDQAAATLARDRATAENAGKEAERYGQLVQKRYVTQEQADQQRATAAAAAATVSADQAAVANARFNLDNTAIRAPISGRTGRLLVRAGNLVHASGTTPLVVINQVRPIMVRFAVPATELPLILQHGAHGGLPVTAVPGGGAPAASVANDTTSSTSLTPASEWSPRPNAAVVQQSAMGTVAAAQGTLSFIDNAVDTTTGTVLLQATFANTGGQLWAGQFAATRLRLFIEQNALIVPGPSVVTGQRGTFVYVVDAANKARQQPVTVERTSGDIAIIVSGLADGERVVTEGQSRLTPGASVNLRPSGDAVGGRKGAGGATRAVGGEVRGP